MAGACFDKLLLKQTNKTATLIQNKSAIVISRKKYCRHGFDDFTGQKFSCNQIIAN